MTDRPACSSPAPAARPGISILRALADEPRRRCSPPTSTRSPPASTWSTRRGGRSCRAATTRGFADALLRAVPARVGRRGRPDGRHRAAAAGARARRATPRPASGSCSPPRRRCAPAWTSGCWPSAAASTVRVPDDRRGRRRVRPRRARPARSSSSRARAAARAASGWSSAARSSRRCARDGTLLVQEHLPGDGVLARRARARRRARRRRGAARPAEGRLRHRGHRPHAARRAPRDASRARSPGHRPHHGRQRAGQGGRRRRARPARGQPALPRHHAADDRRGIDMPKLAIGEALGTPIPDGPLPFEDIAMVRYFEERFFAFDDIADLQRHAAAPIASSNAAAGHARPLDVLRRRATRSRRTSRRREARGADARSACVDHVRVDTDWLPGVRRRGAARCARRRACALRCGDRGQAPRHDGRARPARRLLDGIDADLRRRPPGRRSPTARRTPSDVRERLERGDLTRRGGRRRLVDADRARALDRAAARRHRPPLQHPARSSGSTRPTSPPT